MKNKTLASWLAFVGGALGLHRFYLYGKSDWLAWLLPIPSLLGVYGVVRVRQLGVDDHLSWILMPLLGFTIAGCALTAIVYGLTAAEKWNARFNPSTAPETAGGTNWVTIVAVVFALLVGTAVFMAAISFSFQRYFEYMA